MNQPNPTLLEWLRNSDLTPWIIGAIVVFVVITIVKMAAKMVTKVVGTAGTAAAALGGAQYLGIFQKDSLPALGRDWAAKVQQTTASNDSVETLLRDSRGLLNRVVNLSASKGQEASSQVLNQVTQEIDRKLRESGGSLSADLKAKLQRLKEEVKQSVNERVRSGRVH